MKKDINLSLIVPTYNEAENVEELTKRIFKAWPKTELIFVDDNSPDGTAKVIKQLKKRHNIKLLSRKGKLGLTSAVALGFKHASNDITGVIDADLSHPPEKISELMHALINEDYSLAIGSRNIKGGGVEVWPLHRKLISRIATFIAKPLTKVKDPMSGFFVIRKNILNNINFSSEGYKILLEILVKGNYQKTKEIPYLFRNRLVGKSKLNTQEYIRYLKDIVRLYKCKLRGIKN